MPDSSERPLTQKIDRGKKNTLRLFFAIWPDSLGQEQMSGLTRRLDLQSICCGRKTRAENIHLTLVFIGQVDASELEALLEAGHQTEELGIKAFDLVFDGIRYWKHNRIVYVAVSALPPELMQLVNGLQFAVSDAGYQAEKRPYVPHVTLMKRASCAALPELPGPVIWQVREWMLVKSEQTSGGSVYSPVHRWSLGSPG
ncbi:MAG TPA: RNA 2',3'-cyclic phosphodiesterase [Nitrosospira sp.]|nr:RNA 2',3'-cyclic phosphodiesterase [Nitrosospira sp.]